MSTRKKIEISTLESEYNDCITDFQKFVKAVINQLDELIVSNEISLGFPLQSRIKLFSSIASKHDTGRFNIKKTIFELQDIIGFRIVLLFKRDLEAVEKLLEENFEIVNSYNTEEKLLDNQFGYSSKHFIIKIKNDWLSLPTFRNLDRYHAEIQIRTLSQHIWAETSTVLQYKVESNVPREIVRSIGRVSALLETIDLELERTLQQRDEYIIENEGEINQKTNLNVDVVEIILSKGLPPVPNSTDDLSDILHMFEVYEIKTVIELESLLKDNIVIDKTIVKFYDKKMDSWESYNLVDFTYKSSYIATMLYHLDQQKYKTYMQRV